MATRTQPKCQSEHCKANATVAINHPRFSYPLLQCDQHCHESLDQFTRHGWEACTVQPVIFLC